MISKRKRVTCRARWLRYGVVEKCASKTQAQDGLCRCHKHVRPLEVQVREWGEIRREVGSMMRGARVR